MVEDILGPSLIAKTFFDEVDLGNHICSIYNNRNQQYSTMALFFNAGLKRNHKCVYITEENSKTKVLSELKKYGVDVYKYVKNNQLIILTKYNTYLKSGSFNANKMIQLWQDMEKDALKEGFSGVRVTGEAICLCQNDKESEKVMKYEAQLNGIFPCMKLAALCQYDERKLKNSVMMESLHTHPLLVIYGNPHQNLYFTPLTNIDVENRLPSDSYEMIRDSIVNEE